MKKIIIVAMFIILSVSLICGAWHYHNYVMSVPPVELTGSFGDVPN